MDDSQRMDTAQLTAELEAQRGSVERFKAILEGSRDAIFLSDEISQFVCVNPAACELTGYTEDELLEMRIPDLHEDVDLDAYRTYHASILAGGDALTEAEILRKDGTKVPAEFNNRRVTVGGAVFLHTVARDVTERKRAQEELLKKELELRTILDSTVDGILVVGEDGKVMQTNKRFGRLWRIPQELLETGDDQLFLDFILQQLADPEEFLETVQRIYESAESSLDSISFKDGRLFERYSRPLIADGRSLGRVWSFRDITQRHLAERDLIESRDRLRELAARLDQVRDEERTILARELHDEVGQNLTAMRMDLSAMERDFPELEKVLINRIRPLIDIVQDSVDRVNRISHELRSPVLDMLGLEAAVESEVWEYHERWGTEISLDLSLGELDPDPERDMTVYRVLRESLSNVRRHAEASRVEVGLRVEGERLVLEVMDDGIGITDDQLKDPRSFGLVGMRERVGRLGGVLEIENRPSGGTRISAALRLCSGTGS